MIMFIDTHKIFIHFIGMILASKQLILYLGHPQKLLET